MAYPERCGNSSCGPSDHVGAEQTVATCRPTDAVDLGHKYRMRSGKAGLCIDCTTEWTSLFACASPQNYARIDGKICRAGVGKPGPEWRFVNMRTRLVNKLPTTYRKALLGKRQFEGRSLNGLLLWGLLCSDFPARLCRARAFVGPSFQPRRGVL